LIFKRFKSRSHELERIDTGDYTLAEYETYLREIAFINRYLGDRRALRKTLLADIAAADLQCFSVLDVGAGSGELLRSVSEFAENTGRSVFSVGLDLNETSTKTVAADSAAFNSIFAIRGDALRLPFCDGAFDYAMCSLFMHHLNDEQIVAALREMSRVSRRGIHVIDLHRHPAAYAFYKLFCLGFGISPLVREDGSLSILRGFKPSELRSLSGLFGMEISKVERKMPFRVVMCGKKRRSWHRTETDCMHL